MCIEEVSDFANFLEINKRENNTTNTHKSKRSFSLFIDNKSYYQRNCQYLNTKQSFDKIKTTLYQFDLITRFTI